MFRNAVSPSGDKPPQHNIIQSVYSFSVYSLSGKRNSDYCFSIELNALTGKKNGN